MLSTNTHRQAQYFIFKCTSTTKIYTLSLHDALPIFEATRWIKQNLPYAKVSGGVSNISFSFRGNNTDRKSTRLNSSHVRISYAVFCLKKKTTILRRGHPQLSSRIIRYSAQLGRLISS